MVWGEYQPTEKSTTCKSLNRGYLLLLAVVCFLVPLLTMIYCYTKVFLKVRGHRKRLNSWKKNSRGIKSEFKTAKIVFTVLATFVVAWAPYVIVYLLSTNIHETTIPPAVFKFCGFLSAAHSMCNPIIYFTMNKAFRRDAISFVPFLERHFSLTVSSEHTRNSYSISYEREKNSISRQTFSEDIKKKKRPDNLEMATTG